MNTVLKQSLVLSIYMAGIYILLSVPTACKTTIATKSCKDDLEGRDSFCNKYYSFPCMIKEVSNAVEPIIANWTNPVMTWFLVAASIYFITAFSFDVFTFQKFVTPTVIFLFFILPFLNYKSLSKFNANDA